jgi:hypothetical protein
MQHEIAEPPRRSLKLAENDTIDIPAFTQLVRDSIKSFICDASELQPRGTFMPNTALTKDVWKLHSA